MSLASWALYGRQNFSIITCFCVSDFASCKKYGTSYRVLPKNYECPKSSSRNVLHKQVWCCIYSPVKLHCQWMDSVFCLAFLKRIIHITWHIYILKACDMWYNWVTLISLACPKSYSIHSSRCWMTCGCRSPRGQKTRPLWAQRRPRLRSISTAVKMNASRYVAVTLFLPYSFSYPSLPPYRCGCWRCNEDSTDPVAALSCCCSDECAFCASFLCILFAEVIERWLCPVLHGLRSYLKGFQTAGGTFEA